MRHGDRHGNSHQEAAVHGWPGPLTAARDQYLAWLLKAQDDPGITDFEKRSQQCEENRLELGREIRAIQNDRISILEKLLEKGDVE